LLCAEQHETTAFCGHNLYPAFSNISDPKLREQGQAHVHLVAAAFLQSAIRMLWRHYHRFECAKWGIVEHAECLLQRRFVMHLAAGLSKLVYGLS
jgi:hypothetical protein